MKHACPPSNASTAQAVRVVVKYLRENPERLNMPASVLVTDAIRIHFRASRRAAFGIAAFMLGTRPHDVRCTSGDSSQIVYPSVGGMLCCNKLVSDGLPPKR